MFPAAGILVGRRDESVSTFICFFWWYGSAWSKRQPNSSRRQKTPWHRWDVMRMRYAGRLTTQLVGCQSATASVPVSIAASHAANRCSSLAIFSFHWTGSAPASTSLPTLSVCWWTRWFVSVITELWQLVRLLEVWLKGTCLLRFRFIIVSSRGCFITIAFQLCFRIRHQEGARKIEGLSSSRTHQVLVWRC
jgi:hypothetical protein